MNSVMRSLQIFNHVGTLWNHSVWVQRRVRGEVMHLNVLHTDRAGHTMHLVDLPHIIIDVFVGGQAAHVALEVYYIHLVESH